VAARDMFLGPARTPEAIHAVLADAFGRGDLDALVDLYDDDAALVVPTDGRVVRGRTDIRAATAPLLAASPRLTSVVERKLESGGLALTHARWELDGTAADGSLIRLSGRGTIVSRRRPDGTWGVVLDDPTAV
jgi:ketosteroid isomerase-like protein